MFMLGLWWRTKLDLVLPSWNSQTWQKQTGFYSCQGWSSILPSVPPCYPFIWYILTAFPKYFSSFKFVFKWPSLFPCPKLLHSSWVTEGAQTCVPRADMHLTAQTTSEGWANPLDLEIRPGQVSWVLCAWVFLSVKDGEHVHLMWAGLNIKTQAASSHPHLHFLFFCLIFLQWNGLNII